MALANNTMNRPTSLLANFIIILLGIGAGAAVWLSSAAYDHYVIGMGSFLECLFASTEASMAVRYAAITSAATAGVLGQLLFNRAVGQRRLQTLFDKANDGLLLLDPGTGHIRSANEKALTLLGYERSELSEITVATLHPHDFHIVSAFLEEVRQSGSGITDEVSCRRKDGDLLPAEVSASIIESGTTWHVLISIRDITDRREAERQRLQALEDLQIANRSKTEFLANVSHELRTPLNAILGFSHIIAEEQFGTCGNAAYRDYAKDIHDAGSHLLEVVDDLLDLTKIERGTETLVEDEINLAATCRNMVRRVDERARHGNVTVDMAVLSDIPPFLGDARKLKQILSNLLSNAVKFTPAGGRVVVDGGHLPGTGHWLSVADTGIGMEEDDIDKALTPFQQLDGALSRSYEGLGIGLAVTRAFVNLHDGRIGIKSTPGEGTRVTINFPPERALLLDGDAMPDRRDEASA
jgi:PAS domain S-box-containing protein